MLRSDSFLNLTIFRLWSGNTCVRHLFVCSLSKQLKSPPNICALGESILHFDFDICADCARNDFALMTRPRRGLIHSRQNLFCWLLLITCFLVIYIFLWNSMKEVLMDKRKTELVASADFQKRRRKTFGSLLLPPLVLDRAQNRKDFQTQLKEAWTPVRTNDMVGACDYVAISGTDMGIGGARFPLIDFQKIPEKFEN